MSLPTLAELSASYCKTGYSPSSVSGLLPRRGWSAADALTCHCIAKVGLEEWLAEAALFGPAFAQEEILGVTLGEVFAYTDGWQGLEVPLRAEWNSAYWLGREAREECILKPTREREDPTCRPATAKSTRLSHTSFRLPHRSKGLKA